MSAQNQTNPKLSKMSRKQLRRELAFLKNEYRRVQEFNDNIIAYRLKQMRLWRLNRKIQDINAISAMHPKKPRKQPVTHTQVRAETLARAKEIGKEYSRENGFNVQRSEILPFRTIIPCSSDVVVDKSRVASTARRLHYGNTMSLENMRRFRSNNPTTSFDIGSGQVLDMEKIEKLRKRVKYEDLRDETSSKQSLKAILNSKVDIVGQEYIKSYTLILEDSPPKHTDKQSQYTEEQEEYLINLWNEIKTRIPILNSVPIKDLIKTQSGLDGIVIPKNNEQFIQRAQKSCATILADVAEAYSLREIDNDLNLLTGQDWTSKPKAVKIVEESEDDIRIGENEKIVRISTFNDGGNEYYINRNDSEKDKDPITSSTENDDNTVEVCEELSTKAASPQPNLKNKPLPNLTARKAQQAILLETHVNEFVKQFEPFPRFHQPENEPATKESFESGVDKLRSIFEHRE